jgi:hypothetical protein
MSAGLLLSPGTWRDLVILAVTTSYSALVITMALTAVFSSKPSRRKAALEVLRLLVPWRRRMPPPPP